jgi:hypothetical protein
VTIVFFMFRWDWFGFDKNRIGTRYTDIVFFHPVGSAGHVVHFGASGTRNVIALFFMLGWDRYRFDEKCARTRYPELVFLHPAKYAGHIVHSRASGARNVDALFFMLGWATIVSIKSMLGHITLNLYFCNMWDMRVM